jgi:4-aminobutyrate aminotransferase/(S)-3-amino-2-methylpropionate transaminase
LGEGGFVAPPPDYFKVLIDLCHKHGILFIADEVQSGFGRTGALFASERYGIEPDLLVTAKSLGGGLPLAAVTGRAEIMDAPGSRRPRRNFRRQSAFLRRRARRARFV